MRSIPPHTESGNTLARVRSDAPPALLSLPPLTLCALWGELVEAYHGVHGFGRTVAEIYAYRFYIYHPALDTDILSHDSTLYQAYLAQRHRHAATALVNLCALFADTYPCQVQIEGMPPERWERWVGERFTHRAVIEVTWSTTREEV